MKILLFASILWTTFALAQAPEPALPTVGEKAVDSVKDSEKWVEKALAATRERRENSTWTLNANYTYFDLWVPSKFGVSVAYNRSASSTFELEYLHGSLGYNYFHVNLGQLVDERYTLAWRSYNQRNSFNFLVGLNYQIYRVLLGERFLKTVTNSKDGVDLLELSTIGFTWSMGNRWQMKSGVVWGLDWLVINVPLFTVHTNTPYLDRSNNRDAQNDVQAALNTFRDIPTAGALKIQLGYSF